MLRKKIIGLTIGILRVIKVHAYLKVKIKAIDGTFPDEITFYVGKD